MRRSAKLWVTALALLVVGWLAVLRAQACPPAPPAAPTTAGPAPLSSRISFPAAARVVAIGDLHGDLDAARRALRLAGAIDASDTWIGGALWVVQTGDVIDRGDDDRAVIDLLEKLHGPARSAGGGLLLLSGNHEVMNVAGDFRYVTPASNGPFDGTSGRTTAFGPGGPYATLLATRPIVGRLGDTLFAHGGILPEHVAYGLDRMADEVSAWMLGTRRELPRRALAEDSPIWTRAYSLAPTAEDCARLSEVLRALKSRRLVVGHTVQRTGINAACDGQVWRIDVGMSRHYGGPIEVLEIHGNAVSVRRE